MPYETQSQWTIDELKKLNKAMLVGLHKPYLVFIIILEVIFAGGFIVSAMIASGKLMAEFAALFIILPLSLYLITTYRIKKEYNTNKILQTTVTTFKFDEDREAASSASSGSSSSSN
ncbi:MAG: hypothetical protein IJJ64_03735 [Butyrivibrio sp.]|nr:hypothetical protein [Butyrivibrio sp.]